VLNPTDPVEAAVALARTFDSCGVSYALGGAIAYGIWAIPRATLDVDINVFLEDSELPQLARALSTLGIVVDVGRLQADSAARGMSVVRFGMFRVDLFTPSIPFAREAERTRRVVELEHEKVFVLAPEALSVFKMLFFRPKDVVDLERLLAVQRAAIDTAYVRGVLVDMMGAQDARVIRWDELVAASGTMPRQS